MWLSRAGWFVNKQWPSFQDVSLLIGPRFGDHLDHSVVTMPHG